MLKGAVGRVTDGEAGGWTAHRDDVGTIKKSPERCGKINIGSWIPSRIPIEHCRPVWVADCWRGGMLPNFCRPQGLSSKTPGAGRLAEVVPECYGALPQSVLKWT